MEIIFGENENRQSEKAGAYHSAITDIIRQRPGGHIRSEREWL